MEKDLKSTAEELDRLLKEGEELRQALELNRIRVRKLKSYERILKTHGREYAEFSKLLYAECSFVYPKGRPEQGTETVVVSLDLNSNGHLEEIYRHTADHYYMEWTGTCRLEDLLRFYGQAKLRGFNPTVVFADYYKSDLQKTLSIGNLFGNLGRLLEDPAYGATFEYAATGAPLLQACAACGKWVSVTNSTCPTGAACTASLIKGLGYFDEEELLLCDCGDKTSE